MEKALRQDTNATVNNITVPFLTTGIATINSTTANAATVTMSSCTSTILQHCAAKLVDEKKCKKNYP